MAKKRIARCIDILLGAERYSLQLVFGALIHQRALLAIERKRVGVAFNQILPNLRSDAFENPAHMRDNRIVAPQRMSRLQDVINAQQSKRYRDHQDPRSGCKSDHGENDADPDTQGIGFDYFWSPDATNGTWEENAQATLPSGTYESVQTWGNLDGCPLNGVWQMEICDLWGSDNGFVFDWAIQFADSLYPAELSFTPTFGLECDSTYWTTLEQDQHIVYNGQWNCADVGVTMTTPGPQVYTAHAVNNFGCEFTQEVSVNYVAFDAAIEASSEIFCGVPVELEVAVSGANPEDLTVTWEPSPYLSDTLGASVIVSGMNSPQSFQANVSQAYDEFPGLLCATSNSITIGTCEIMIPNVVTPYSTSGDNDNFRIPGIESYEDVEITILNRWGNVVFESKDFGLSPVWDCAADGASSGVYFYILTIPVEEGPLVVTDVNGERVEYDGEGPFTFEGFFELFD